MENLVYAELMGSVTFDMLADRKLLILSDNAIFIITFEENAVNYTSETFYPVGEEAIRDYEIKVVDGRIVSDLYPKIRL